MFSKTKNSPGKRLNFAVSMTRWVSTELKLNARLTAVFFMFWKSCAHSAEQAKCQGEHLIRELTFPAASSLEGAVDRQETQQREKNPHVCARISPHRVLTPSPGVCQNTTEDRMAAGFALTTNLAPLPLRDRRRPVSPASSVRPVIVKSQLFFPLLSPLHRGNPPQRQIKNPFKKINTRTTFF